METRFQVKFPTHRINIDRAQPIPGESILIDGLTIEKATARGVRDVLKIGRVTCQGPIDLIGIIQGQVPIDTVILDGLDLSLWPTADNAWSIHELIPRESKPANRIPNIHIRSGLLRIGHPSGYLAREILCHDLQGILTEQSAPSDRSGKIDTEQVLSASLSSSHFSRLAIQAKRYSTTGNIDIACDLEQLEISKTLLQQLPNSLRDRIGMLQGFTGRLDGAFRGSYSDHGFPFQAHATVRDGRLLHPNVPYPIDQLSAELHFDPQGIHLRKGQGRSGKATVSLECDINGFNLGAPLIAGIAIRQLELDETLYKALPASAQEHWRRLNLRGSIDALASVHFDGQNWSPHLTIRARDGGANPDFFPYPIHNISGDFHYRDGVIEAPELSAMAGQQRLNGSLTLPRASPRWPMALTNPSASPLPHDRNLLKHPTPPGFGDSVRCL